MANRTKIYIRNKKGAKKTLVIVSGLIDQRGVERMREGLNEWSSSNKPFVVLSLPVGCNWQVIRL